MSDTHLSTILLYVEDEVLIQEMVEAALNDAGFEVRLASDGAEALEIIRKNPEAFRGLITDINLGDGHDGWKIARRARELIPGLPVVYVSGASGHEWTSRGVPQSLLVAKPFAAAQIVTAISTALNTADTHQAGT